MPKHAPHAGWETYCLAHSPTFAQMYARTCISRQMLGGTLVMQLHPPAYAGHDIRNAPNAMALWPVSGAFRRIVYATAYRTVRGVKRRLNPTQHRRTHGIQKPEPRIRQGYHSAVRDTGHGTRPAAGISHIQRLLQSPFISTDGVEDEHTDDSADTENAEYPALAPPCRARGSARDLAEREPSLADAFTFSGGSNRRPYPLMMKTQTGMPQS